MAQKLTLSDLFGDRESHKTILKIGVVMLLVMELIIYLVANAHSGIQSRVAIYDAKGNEVYETDGSIMTRYEKLVFENTYGPLSNYQVKTISQSVPFPFRAWLAVAVGVPIGFVLLLGYLVRTYLSFVGGEEESPDNSASLNDSSGLFGQWSKWKRLSLFNLGFLVLIFVLALWLVPNLVADVTQGIISLAIKYKWVTLGVAVFFASLLVWIIYLRYKISQRMMDLRIDLEKFRVEKELLLERETRLALPRAAASEHADEGAAALPPREAAGRG